MAYQDTVFQSLEGSGFTGSLNDMLFSYYRANGATGNTLNELSYSFLLLKGFTQPTLNDRWYGYNRANQLSIGNTLPAVSANLDGLISNIFTTASGAWYDPSLAAARYQDYAGTTPTTEAGQPVGLVLDRRLGLISGVERVSNGAFDSYDGWALGDGSIQISGGSLRFSSTPNGVSATGAGATTAPTIGMGFWCELDITSLTTGQVRVIYAGSVVATFASVGKKRVFFFGANTGNIPIIQAIGTTTAIVDDFSIRQLLGSHAIQATAPARPTLQTGPDRFEFDGIDDAHTTTGLTPGSNYTIVLAKPGVGAVTSVGQTVGTTFTNTENHCGMLLCNRALTAAETAAVTQWANKKAGV